MDAKTKRVLEIGAEYAQLEARMKELDEELSKLLKNGAAAANGKAALEATVSPKGATARVTKERTEMVTNFLGKRKRGATFTQIVKEAWTYPEGVRKVLANLTKKGIVVERTVKKKNSLGRMQPRTIYMMAN